MLPHVEGKNSMFKVKLEIGGGGNGSREKNG